MELTGRGLKFRHNFRLLLDDTGRIRLGTPFSPYILIRRFHGTGKCLRIAQGRGLHPPAHIVSEVGETLDVPGQVDRLGDVIG